MGRKAHTFSTEKKHSLECKWCGVTFRSARKDAKTCCNAHRLKLSRAVRKGMGDYMADEQAARGRNEAEAIAKAIKMLKGK